MAEKTRDDPGADRLLCVALRDLAAGVWPLRIVWLVVVAIDLLEEGLGVECCVGRAGDAGDDRKRNQGGQDGLHGISPLISYPLQCGCECVVPQFGSGRCYLGNNQGRL
jgi:hypothetical protein